MMAGTGTGPALEVVARFLGARTGLAVGQSRRDETMAGIQRAMARARVSDASRYLELLVKGEAALDDLISEVTVGETYFFREPAQFEAVRSEIVPDLLQLREPGHVLRVWSAGCASGEEAYSLAILFDRAGLGGRARILGTDISRAALARARAAVYGSWSLRGVDATITSRFFRQAGDRWRLDEAIRSRVDFEYLNLALDAYPSSAAGIWGMDLVVCRNVLIYLDREAIARVARGLHAALADGGWLITGPSDPPLGEAAPFETVVTPSGVFYRRAGDHGRVVLFSRGGPSTWAPAAAAAVAAPKVEPARSPQVASAPGRDRLAVARAAFEAGDYDQVLALTDEPGQEAAAVAFRLRAIANRTGSREAAQAAAVEVERHPLSTELHFLNAVLLVDLGRDRDAERAVKRVIYLDRSSAVAHQLLGSILRRLGDSGGARRAYRNARELAAARPADESLALGDGERAARLVAAASAELALLDEPGEARP